MAGEFHYNLGRDADGEHEADEGLAAAVGADFGAPQEPADYQRVFFFRPTFRPSFAFSAPYCVVLQNTASAALCWRF